MVSAVLKYRTPGSQSQTKILLVGSVVCGSQWWHRCTSLLLCQAKTECHPRIWFCWNRMQWFHFIFWCIHHLKLCRLVGLRDICSCSKGWWTQSNACYQGGGVHCGIHSMHWGQSSFFPWGTNLAWWKGNWVWQAPSQPSIKGVPFLFTAPTHPYLIIVLYACIVASYMYPIRSWLIPVWSSNNLVQSIQLWVGFKGVQANLLNPPGYWHVWCVCLVPWTFGSWKSVVLHGEQFCLAQMTMWRQPASENMSQLWQVLRLG